MSKDLHLTYSVSPPTRHVGLANYGLDRGILHLAVSWGNERLVQMQIRTTMCEIGVVNDKMCRTLSGMRDLAPNPVMLKSPYWNVISLVKITKASSRKQILIRGPHVKLHQL